MKLPLMKFLAVSFSALLFATFSGVGLQAQLITWGSPTNISSASDIATNGAYVDALQSHTGNGAGGVVPLNVLNPTTGISTLFNTFATGTVADGTFSFSNNIGTDGSDGSNSDATPYLEALDHTSYIFRPGSATVTMGGLATGDLYQLQVWCSAGYRPTTLTSGADSVNLNFVPNTTGQYVLGTFVAVGSTESFTFANSYPIDVSAGEVNALALRDLSNAPEPSTYAMLLGGWVLMGFCVRRKLAQVCL